MRLRLVIVLLISACGLTLHARLGETEAELIQRFGKPTLTGKDTIIAQGQIIPLGVSHTFKQDDWLIMVTVIDDRCAKIKYYHRGEWTEEQFQTVLTANAQGAKWKDISTPASSKMIRKWQREDRGSALWQSTEGIVLQNPAYDRAKAELEAKAKSKARQIPKI